MSSVLFKLRFPECSVTNNFPTPGTPLTRLYCKSYCLPLNSLRVFRLNVAMSLKIFQFCLSILSISHRTDEFLKIYKDYNHIVM